MSEDMCVEIQANDQTWASFTEGERNELRRWLIRNGVNPSYTVVVRLIGEGRILVYGFESEWWLSGPSWREVQIKEPPPAAWPVYVPRPPAS